MVTDFLDRVLKGKLSSSDFPSSMFVMKSCMFPCSWRGEPQPQTKEQNHHIMLGFAQPSSTLVMGFLDKLRLLNFKHL